MMPTPRLRPASKLSFVLAATGFACLTASVLLRLSAYGIWDPWELSVADAARKLADGTLTTEPVQLPLRLVSLGFAAFGTREWAGRLPMALSGLGLLAVTFAWARRFTTTRLGVYATIALGTTPFFLLHSREMVGAAPSLLASALVMWGASNAAFGPGRTSVERDRAPWGWLALAALGAVLGAVSNGIMLSVVPPLASVALVALLVGTPDDLPPARRVARQVVIVLGIGTVLAVVLAVLRHAADYSVWLGGAAIDPSVPTYERSLSQLFHAFVPWSAVFPVALAALLRMDAARPDQPLRLLCVTWAAIAYAAQSVYISSFGNAAFPAPMALGVAAALWLSDREQDQRSYWPEAVVVLLFVGLQIRDFALYPASPIDALQIGDTKLPDAFNPKRAWSALLGAFGVTIALACMAGTPRVQPDLRAPYRGVKRLWSMSWGHRVWLVLAALLALGLLAFGAIAWLNLSAIPLTSLARRIGRVVMFVPLAIPVGVVLGQFIYGLSAKLMPVRSVPVMTAALAIGAHTSLWFLPKLSEHFSPREVFDTYNQLARPDEPLAQHEVEGRAAAYYAKGKVREMKSRNELIDYLAEPGRRWAAFPSAQIADVDVAFRRRTGRHLFLPVSENGRVALVANEAIAGRKDENPLTRFVRKTPPAVQHTLNAKFENKIELIGYNIELPGGKSVGPGQTFHVTWVWRALQGNLGAYKVFVHGDAPGQRLNGDHEPVDGKYPVRLWDVGDVIVDRQAISVPATYRSGTYTLFVGFFRGESRIKVASGTQDGADRLQAGKLEIR